MSSSRLLQGLTVAAFIGFALHHAADAAPQTTGTFTPQQIPNLAAWFDPSQVAGVGGGAGVNFLRDWSGNNNGLYQANTAKQPVFTNVGINKLGSLVFNGKSDLVGLNASFSKYLFNESSVFIVSNQSNATQASSLLWTGPYQNNPRWDLRLSESGNTHFDFDNSAGRLSYRNDPVGPSLWTAEASVSAKTQILHKNGNAVASGRPYGSTVTGNFPVELGGTNDGSALAYQYSGLIGEVLVYNRALTPSETAEAEGYLACKWGLQTQLPAGHPYRTVCPQGSQPTPSPAPSASPVSNPVVDPPHLVSANGSLTFNVTASQAANGNPQFAYNGSAVMPTLELSPGDTLYVNLTNLLPKPPNNAGYLNDTSLHYHGLHVSPNAPGDDSIDMIAMPGQTLHYKVAIPTNHPSGLYWYHSHAHGEAERQNLAGMSGALIIDGIEKSVPAVTNLPQRILIARDTVVAGQALPLADKNQVKAMFWAMSHGARMPALPGMAGMSMDTPVRGNSNRATRNPYVDTNPKYKTVVRSAADSHCLASSPEAPSRNWTLNGQTTPAIGIKPGERQFWRLVNAGSDTYLDVQVDNTTMQIVGLDGVPLASVGNAPMTVGHYLLPPASRMEFIVTGPAAGTTAFLRTNCFDAGASGLAMPATILAKIDPSHSVTTSAAKIVRATRNRNGSIVAGRLHSVTYIKAFVNANGIARKQTLTYSDQDQINGQSYDPSGPAQFYAQSGTMEQWQIVNVSDQVHTFHIHQTHFLVDSIVGGSAIEQNNVGQELDNINVPAANANGPGSVTLTMDFTDPAIIGTFLLHCHILSHEDMGMMAKIRVGTSPPLTTSAPAAGISFPSVSAPSATITVSGGAKPYSLSGCSGVASASVNGAAVTVKPSAPGACVLIVADSSGLTANVAVSVVAVASPVTVSPKSLAFSTPASASQNAGISGGKQPYSVSSACGNIAAAQVTNATLTVVPHAAGSCAVIVSDASKNTYSVSITVNAATTSYSSDVATFHNNNARQGWNQSETALTTTNVNANSFGELHFLTGSGYGKVYAQPLFASNETINGTKHNLVLVATATDQAYAYDDRTYALVWHRSFTNPSAGITQQIWSDLGSCRDVNPDIGITGTPVIDRSLDRMYVVVPTKENGTFHQRLHAISLQNGSDAVGPVEVSASEELAGNQGVVSTNPQHNFNRTALLEANGAIYVGFGSHCDGYQNITHGWLLAYNTSTLAPAGTVFNAVDAVSNTGNYLGALWMSGYGPAADSSGNVYFATGNGPWNGVSSFGMSDLKLPGNLNVANGSYFTVYNQAALSNSDGDLGSGGIMLLPDGLSPKYPHLALQGGKTQIKYLLNRDNMGGYKPGDAGAVWQGMIPGGFNGQSFFQDGSGNAYVVGGTGNIGTYLFDPASATLVLKSRASIPGSCMECRNGGSQSIVSSNGTDAGTTIVWTLHTGGTAGGTIALYAYDASSMRFLYTGNAGDWEPGSNAGGIIGSAFISPMEANGKVYVPTDGGVAVFGLK